MRKKINYYLLLMYTKWVLWKWAKQDQIKELADKMRRMK